MSYRNPQIIVDRSAEIYAKLPGMIGQSFAKGIGNYLDYRSKVNAAQKKKDEGFLAELNSQEKSAWENLEKGLSKKNVDDISLIEQVKGLVATKLEGGKDNIGVLKKRTAVSLGTVSGETLKQYKQDIKDYETWEARTINNIGAYEVQAEKYQDLDASTYGKKYDFAGVGNDKFKNMVAVASFNDREVSGVNVKRELTDNEIIIRGSIDKNSDAYKQYVANGLLVEGGDGITEKDGVVSFEWKRDAKKPINDLIIDLMPEFDYVEASKNAGIQDSKGNVQDNIYDTQAERKVTTKPFGENKVQDVTRIYINEDAIRTNKVFVDEAEAYATAFQVSSYEQKLNYASRLGFEGDELTELMNNPSLQKSIITRHIIDSNIERLTGANKLNYDEEGRMYIEEYGTPYKPTPDLDQDKDEKPTTSELKIEAFNNKIEEQGGREEFYKAFVKGPGANAADKLSEILEGLAIPNEVIQFQDKKGNVDQDVIRIDVAGKEDKINIDISNPEMAIAKLQYAISGDYNYVREQLSKN